ncbi:MAG TPA: nuclear transport factor 2 family protein [Candidatus Acidoferrales bacterium]|nr:nuclear transport factor 2 family protein [Candidatus Acidoferrales bacterium]
MSKTLIKEMFFRKSTALVALILFVIPTIHARRATSQEPSESVTAREIISMLRQFMDDATHNNAPGFDRFFADDVIYTRSAGVVITKADIMKSVANAKPSANPGSVYSAEDVTVHEYPNIAVVAFRLVSRTSKTDGTTEISNYRNTGIFLRRNGQWQVVAWQSTKIPDSTPPK